MPAGETFPLDHLAAFLETRQEDRPAEPFEDVRPDSIIDHGLRTQICIIDGNALLRTCLMRCLKACDPDLSIDAYQDVAEWRHAMTQGPGAIFLLCATGKEQTETLVRQDVMAVIEAVPDACVIVVSDFEDPTEIAHALAGGAKGYISMKADVDVAFAAIGLVRAGGIFVPASCLLALRSPPAAPFEPSAHDKPPGVFTPRQLDVIACLRKGESNKFIAYKLGMGECTVKVHIHNVMRKINARSRTEVAFMTNELFGA